MTTTSAQPTFAEPRIVREDAPDGRILLRSTDALEPHAVSVVHDFRAHGAVHPDRLLLAEPDGGCGWSRTSWGEMRVAVDRCAQGLLDRDLADRPIMILSGNSTLHLTVALAAMTLGTPVVPTSTVRAPRTSQTIFPLVSALLFDGCTRFGSPGIFGVPTANALC